MVRRRSSLPTLLLLAAVGCGGSPEIQPDVTPPKAIALTATADYNGTRGGLRQSYLEGVSAGTVTTVAVTNGDRKLEVAIPTITPNVGDVFILGANGAEATYSEGTTRRWRATGGTFTVRRIEEITFQGTLEAAAFAADPTTASARGGFVASTLTALTFGYGIDEGPSAVTLANAETEATNATLRAFGAGATTRFNGGFGLDVTLSEGMVGGGSRRLTLSLPENADAGATGTFVAGVPGILTYAEGRGGRDRVWSSTGGTWRIVSRSRSNIAVEISGVTMTPSPFSTATATGTLRLDGTLRR